MENIKKVLYATLAVLSVALVVLVFFTVRNSWREYDYIGRTAQQDNEITISGTAEQVVVPDVAKVRIGVFNTASQVAAAQTKTTERMNDIISSVKTLGIDSADIKTVAYSVDPEYDYNDGRRDLIGYRVTQSIEVTIREIDKSSQVLSTATAKGANDVGSLRFEVDDLETVKQQARIEALANARVKAKEMADTLDVKLGRIVSFSEDTVVPPSVLYGREASFGLGGVADAEIAPTIEPGTNEVTATVYVTFELL